MVKYKSAYSLKVFVMEQLKNTGYPSEINDSLIANINHALRTPLNGVMGMMDLLCKTGLNKSQMKYANIIREANEMLMLQLENIVELAKFEDGESVVQNQECKLDDIVKQSVQSVIGAAVKKGIPISIHWGDGLPEMIRTDKNKLRLILTNLFSCALQLSACGVVTLNITKENVGSAEKPEYKLRFLWENTKVFHEALQGKAREYNDLKDADLREFGEITVSLVAAQKLLDAMGAVVRFDHLREIHEPPFHFDIALKEGSEEAKETPFSVLKGKHALIIQKDILEQNILTQCLNLWDVRTCIVGDEKRAIKEFELARKRGEDFDLVFLDNTLSDTHFATLSEGIEHVVMILDKVENLDQDNRDVAAKLILPAYPQELLHVLSSLYQDEVRMIEDKMLAQNASSLLTANEFSPVTANVMVVEDDATNRFYANELLEGLGCRVKTVENGESAIRALYNNADYDLIFMDCMMPVMDGYTATKKIREEGFAHIPIIALTANTSERDRERCISAGMTDYITKPVREQDMHDMLEKYTKQSDVR